MEFHEIYFDASKIMIPLYTKAKPYTQNSNVQKCEVQLPKLRQPLFYPCKFLFVSYMEMQSKQVHFNLCFTCLNSDVISEKMSALKDQDK